MLITEPFQVTIASAASKLGTPGFHSLVVPHPIWGKDEDGLRDLARSLVDRARAQLV